MAKENDSAANLHLHMHDAPSSIKISPNKVLVKPSTLSFSTFSNHLVLHGFIFFSVNVLNRTIFSKKPYQVSTNNFTRHI